MPYQADFSAFKAHPSGYYHGASLAALEKLGQEKGYALVAVDTAGVNAFFVHDAARPENLRARFCSRVVPLAFHAQPRAFSGRAMGLDRASVL